MFAILPMSVVGETFISNLLAHYVQTLLLRNTLLPRTVGEIKFGEIFVTKYEPLPKKVLASKDFVVHGIIITFKNT